MIWRRIWQKKNSWISGARYVCSHSTKPTPPTTSARKNSILGFPSSSSSLIRSRYVSASTSFSMHIDLNSQYSTKKCCFSSQALLDPPIGGIIEIPLAQTGEGIAECELLQWFVQEGDQVEEFQPLCEVQSDKATIEITSRYKGKVSQILYGPGDIVKVGETLLKMVSEQSQTSTLISDGLKDTFSLASDTCELSSEKLPLDKHNLGGVLSTPAVRHLAKEYGININDIQGTGKEGRVLKEDVLKYAVDRGLCEISAPSSQASSMEQPLIKEEKYLHTLAVDGWHFEDKTMPLRGFQRSMVKSMTAAAKVPHFHYLEEINCDALVELKAAFQNENSDPDVKHTYLPFLIKSLSMALTKYPLLNSSFNEELHEIILKGSHNIGVAMATPYGLVVPNIKKVQSLSILEITKELSRLQKLALNNKLCTEDISGGTITLSNIGAIGGKYGSPILNLPEVAIIAIGRIQKLPRFADDGSVYPASIINVNIGADHRIVDGATVARFCNEWKLLIEKPELLMLDMR
ncbi:Biotin/lipoyl attachment [Macleaya cordata]|uniref:Dihydrolipoamide acetyltransferase component of pyruvate dehydrogenase complex n=1 Tax=Macleaya cordata TaxID=56857 RepID=A0A200PWP8_MACCD|nr:Biotin/lipoyl attachment [Macleaya cordata]